MFKRIAIGALLLCGAAVATPASAAPGNCTPAVPATGPSPIAVSHSGGFCSINDFFNGVLKPLITVGSWAIGVSSSATFQSDIFPTLVATSPVVVTQNRSWNLVVSRVSEFLYEASGVTANNVSVFSDVPVQVNFQETYNNSATVTPVPGPELAGLPFLALAGGYLVYRRRKAA